MSELTKELASQNGNQASAMLGELTGNELLTQNGNQASAMLGELTGNELLTQNGNQAGVGVAEHFDELDKRPKILTFTANEDGSSVGFCCWSEYYEPVDMGKNMQYSTDGGKTWEDYTIGVGEDNLVAIELNEGESVMFRGNNENLAYYLEDKGDYIYTKCFIDGSVAASGDVTSLLNGVGGDATLAVSCYYYMFSGCTGLTQAPALPATTLAVSCYSYMFIGCTQITSHHVATLNNSAGIFVNNSSCGSFTIDAETPPTISDDTISGLKADCIIYVPSASVDAYKAKQYWSARASYIQAQP